ncbi:hypothetical protein LC612_22770 [Nostoc sp. CHAB 5834]|nr:hypothetical protein [Nostoc sp. CHAB 5834]
MKYKIVLQHSEEDCGAACIANYQMNGQELGFSGVDAVCDWLKAAIKK